MICYKTKCSPPVWRISEIEKVLYRTTPFFMDVKGLFLNKPRWRCSNNSYHLKVEFPAWFLPLDRKGIMIWRGASLRSGRPRLRWSRLSLGRGLKRSAGRWGSAMRRSTSGRRSAAWSIGAQTVKAARGRKDQAQEAGRRFEPGQDHAARRVVKKALKSSRKRILIDELRSRYCASLRQSYALQLPMRCSMAGAYVHWRWETTIRGRAGPSRWSQNLKGGDIVNTNNSPPKVLTIGSWRIGLKR